ncbi:chemotaxis protein MotA [Kineothrix alysoides]|uniref:Chemotaxis protein MotA n=1 Tax=Kineothrix alysoides TaxID=1469948 RepID=A0A4R1QRT4_9FIRM|nr:motility protein A [Kineothrix alysoides]TCL56586.1 chemotaxis protein MotA [Kineothrix alysoides]
MDIASILGLVLCGIVFIFGILTSGGISAIGSYWDIPSVFITFGGSLCCVLASYSLHNFTEGIKSFRLVLRTPDNNTPETIRQIIELSNIARKEGLLSLEERAASLDDEFLKKGILLIVDGTDQELVRAIMDTELASIEERHKTKIGFWDALGAMGPAWGMIGTLVGLVDMLNRMDDPSAIGPGMATALITTLYGSLLANWICTPVASKLRENNAEEVRLKEIMIEGLLSIQAGENPRVIEEKLKSFLSPRDKESWSSESGGEPIG